MTLLDLSLPSPAENLACDEVLLDLCDEGEIGGVLRFWEPCEPFVVVGYANSVDLEVNTSFCAKAGIPIFRRCSGGGTVLQARGCLNYSVVLRMDSAPELAGIHTTNGFVLRKIADAMARVLNQRVDIRGQTDLALSNLKIAGNAQRRKKAALLFHGCLLLDLDLHLVQQALASPSRQPDYRGNRSHLEFMTNTRAPAAPIKTALTLEWKAQAGTFAPPLEQIGRLAREKYESFQWNHRF